MLDIICSSPGQKSFTLQVKSLSGSNWVLIRKEHLASQPRCDPYFAVVWVTSDDAKPFVFHFLTHAEVCADFKNQSKLRKDGRPFKPGMEGIAWSYVRKSQDRWDKLPR